MNERWRIGFFDLHGVYCQISIFDPDFVGDYTVLKASKDPLKFFYDNESDDVFDPIRSSRVTFEVVSLTNFVLQDFYNAEDMHYPVDIYFNDTLFWTGYIESQKYEESYDIAPYIVSITATDGLSILENILFADSISYNAGEEIITYYNGHKLESKILLDILGKIGHIQFKEYVNMYETRMLSGAGDSPFDQTEINRDLFRDDYCYDVLFKLLKKKNAVIRQKDGIFCIVRPKELIDKTVYGRWFTGETTKTAISMNPDQFIKRIATHPSTKRIQVPGGRLMIQSPVKKVSAVFDYGNKESWIDNYQFKSNSYDRSIWKFSDWEHEDDVGVNPISDLVPGETEGFMFNTHNPTGEHIQCIYQNFGNNAVITSDDFELSFEYMFYNYDVILINDAVFYIEIRNIASTRWLKATTVGDNVITDIEWITTRNFIAIVADVPPGKMDWITFERKISGLPVNGGFIIKIYASYANELAIFPGIKNIKINTTSSGISLKSETRLVPDRKFRLFGGPRKKTIYYFPSEPKTVVESKYTIANLISSGRELDYDCLLGDITDAEIDNVLEQFEGALGIMARTNAYRVDTITLTGTTGELDIMVSSVTGRATFLTNLSITAQNFVTDNEAAFDAVGITITSVGSSIIFTSQILGAEFDGETIITNVSGNLFGTIEYTSPSYTVSLEPSILWKYRGGSSYKPLFHHMTDEIASEYSKPRQLIQMPIQEVAQSIQIDIIGNFQDDLNIVDGVVRLFVMNRGTFDVKNRKWEIDLHEIGTVIPESTSESDGDITADNDVITVDNDVITVDKV